MIVPGRHQTYSEGYRYGFQGQEMDNEIKGEGNSINYTFRMHDPRIGRFFAVDPLTKEYPHYTPYSFSGNKPIQYVELEGLEEAKPSSFGISLNVRNFEILKDTDISVALFNSNQLNTATTWDNKLSYNLTQKTLKIDSAINFDHKVEGLPFGATFNTKEVTFALQYKKSFVDNGTEQLWIGLTNQDLGTGQFTPKKALAANADNLFQNKPAAFNEAKLDAESNPLVDIKGTKLKSFFIIKIDDSVPVPAPINAPKNIYQQAASIPVVKKPNFIVKFAVQLIKKKMEEMAKSKIPPAIDPDEQSVQPQN